MIDNPAIAIDSDDKTFMVIWSWGLRCNFDCSYCSPERHNNNSKHTNKEKLLKAVDFLKEYKSAVNGIKLTKFAPPLTKMASKPSHLLSY